MASVQGTVPDQSWALSLPSPFHQNIQPAIYGANFLLPRDNDLIPKVVSKNTTGACYDRGYIDLRPRRKETTRQYITNPSSYVQDLHPFGLGGGTGGVDNLNLLDNHAYPTPYVNMEGAEEMEYFAKRESKTEKLDPLSNSYALDVFGQQGEKLLARVKRTREMVDERNRILANRRELLLREGQAVSGGVVGADIGAANIVSSEAASMLDTAALAQINERAREMAATSPAREAEAADLGERATEMREGVFHLGGLFALPPGVLPSEAALATSNPLSGGSAAGTGTLTDATVFADYASRAAGITEYQTRTLFSPTPTKSALVSRVEGFLQHTRVRGATPNVGAAGGSVDAAVFSNTGGVSARGGENNSVTNTNGDLTSVRSQFADTSYQLSENQRTPASIQQKRARYHTDEISRVALNSDAAANASFNDQAITQQNGNLIMGIDYTQPIDRASVGAFTGSNTGGRANLEAPGMAPAPRITFGALSVPSIGENVKSRRRGQ